MGVYVRFGRQKAFLRYGEWKCANPRLERELNSLTHAWIQKTGGPPIEDHDHELTAAKEIAGRLGGRIMKRVAPQAKANARIYISRRQLDLDF